MTLPRTHTLKQWISTALSLLFILLGLTGTYVSLFPPNGTTPGTGVTLLGMAFSSSFFVVAWLIRRWAKHCLLCQ